MAVRQLKDGRWICYHRLRNPETGKSKEIREYFGRGVDAQVAAQHRHDALGLQKRRPPRAKKGPIFADLAKSYLINQHMAENTRVVLIYKLTANILPYFGLRSVLGLRFRDLDLYVAKRRKEVTDSTIRRELTDIQSILNWSVARRPPLVPQNPVRDYKKPRAYDAVILPPSAAEVNTILEHAADHLRRAITLSYYLGLRPGTIELLSLTWLAVAWDSETILVTSAHKGGPEKRAVPIHPEFMPILRGWFAQDGNGSGPIVHYHGRAIKSIKQAWRQALRRANITRRIRPYDLRHAFATTALERDVDIKALSEIMGSRPETLMRTYQHVTTKLRRETINRMPALPDLTNCDQENIKAVHRKG
jgi:integrase